MFIVSDLPTHQQKSLSSPSSTFPHRLLRGFLRAKMTETYDDGLSSAEFPSVTYTEAVPISCVAPVTESKTNKNKRKEIPQAPKTSTKNKPSVLKKSKKQTVLKPNVERKNFDNVFDETQFDFSKVPPPVCSCTGVARQCHKCGVNGWQSSCCNSKISVFPLPMSPWRPGARVGGRKMSHGAYRKLLCRLASEGHNLSHPVDLKVHWAKHGTNNFVTINQRAFSRAKMTETIDDRPSSAESSVTYTEAVPVRCVAPITEPKTNKNKRKEIPQAPKTSTKNKPSISKKSKKQTALKPNVERKNLDNVLEETQFDFSKVPPPVCSCTGVARQCHKCGVNGWQSSCCNSKISVFPLPMSSWRPGARVGGRKMSHGAYRKLLCRLASEGQNLSHPVDLKAHWAKHGTNNFVTIK